MPTLPEQRSRAANWWRWVFIAVWMTAIVAGLAYYATHAERFTPEHLAADLRRWEHLALLVYLAASVSRALVLIPSTPFVLAGCLLFPDSPWLVLGTSMLAIALSASLLYYGAEHLGLDAYFKRRHPAGIANAAKSRRILGAGRLGLFPGRPDRPGLLCRRDATVAVLAFSGGVVPGGIGGLRVLRLLRPACLAGVDGKLIQVSKKPGTDFPGCRCRPKGCRRRDLNPHNLSDSGF